MSIWKHKEIREDFKDIKHLTLNEGFTPLQKFNFRNSEILIKREDLNPFGSWKDRATALKISLLNSTDNKKGVIASSGNASFSFLNYIQKLLPEFELVILVSKKINKEKLNKMHSIVENSKHKIIETNNPTLVISELVQKGYINLKSSIDNIIPKAYWSLGFELFECFRGRDINNDTAVFCPVSSGTAFVGIAESLHAKLNSEYLLPRMFAVQTISNHPLQNLEKTSYQEEESKADAIYDPKCLRSPQIKKIINITNGGVEVINNNELDEGMKFAHDTLKIKDKISFNSILSLSAFLKQPTQFKKNIIIFSGL